MNNDGLKEGSYIYIPSSSRIFLMQDDKVIDCKKTKQLSKPVYVLYLGENKTNNDFGKVFYEGKVWNVYKENIYPRKENE